jgi:hypothetical protein
MSNGTWHRVFWSIFTHILEEHDVSIFRVEEVFYHGNEGNTVLRKGSLYPEEGDSTFVRNFGIYLQDYMPSHPRRK